MSLGKLKLLLEICNQQANVFTHFLLPPSLTPSLSTLPPLPHTLFLPHTDHPPSYPLLPPSLTPSSTSTLPLSLPHTDHPPSYPLLPPSLSFILFCPGDAAILCGGLRQSFLSGNKRKCGDLFPGAAWPRPNGVQDSDPWGSHAAPTLAPQYLRTQQCHPALQVERDLILGGGDPDQFTHQIKRASASCSLGNSECVLVR